MKDKQEHIRLQRIFDEACSQLEQLLGGHFRIPDVRKTEHGTFSIAAEMPGECTISVEFAPNEGFYLNITARQGSKIGARFHAGWIPNQSWGHEYQSFHIKHTWKHDMPARVKEIIQELQEKPYMEL